MSANHIPAPTILTDLRVSLCYDLARDEANRTAAYPHGTPPNNVCRYCGKPWQPPANTRIDGHVRCLVPVAWQVALADRMMRDPGLTYAAVGAACGASYGAARTWYQGGVDGGAKSPTVRPAPLGKSMRSVSMSAACYARLQVYCTAYRVSISSIVETLIEATIAEDLPAPTVERVPLTRDELDARCAIRDAIRDTKPCQRVKPAVPVSEGMLSMLEDQVQRRREIDGVEADEGEVLDAAIVGALTRLERMTDRGRVLACAAVRRDRPDLADADGER